MNIKINKTNFNLDSPDLASKEAFLKAFPKRKADKIRPAFDPDGYWRAIQQEKNRLEKESKKG